MEAGAVIQVGTIELAIAAAVTLACALVAWITLKGQIGKVQEQNASLEEKLDEANGRLRDLQERR